MSINWSNKKVLVCGGSGLIGSHIGKILANKGSTVFIADNLSSGSLKNVQDFEREFINVDLRYRDNCFELVHRIKPDYIFQLAADMGGIGYITSIGADIMDNSARINMNMVRAYLNSDAKGLFYSSSACVYPEFKQLDAEVTPLKEDDAIPAQPDQFYGWEKLFTEQLCAAYQKDYDLNIRVARFHNVYGEVYTAFDKAKGKAPCHLIYKALTAKDGDTIDVWGDGLQTRSFLYIEDCTEAVLRLMESDHYLPINIGSDELVTIDQLAQYAIKASGKNLSIDHDLSKPQGVRGRNADLTLVKAVLNWQPRYTLEEGIKRTYQWTEKYQGELEL